MAAPVAENYQLKWHSHLSNLNSSVATLYRNEKYADVLLFTSNADGCSGIPAHRLILGSCSHYFASIFETNPLPPNAMIYIVLPPELSKRSVQILIQYMYSGEATVSNDILNEVLRGGEVLRIRGPLIKITEPSVAPVVPPPAASTIKDNPVIVEKSIFEHRPERIASAVIKESPVIVMSPVQLPQQQPNQHYQQQQQQNSHQQSTLSLPLPPTLPPLTQSINVSTQNILVKKENISEPTDNTVPALHYGLVSLQIAAAVKKAQLNTESHMKSTTQENGNGGRIGCGIGNGSLHRYSMDQTKEIEEANHLVKEREILADKHRTMNSNSSNGGSGGNGGGNDDDGSGGSNDQQTTVRHNLEPGEKSRYSGKIIADKKSTIDVQMPETLGFLTIKQEPIDWNDYDSENGIEKSHIEVAVKPEIVYANEETEEEEEEADGMTYSPLTCELCSETFTIPAEWVRHIEGHAETTQCIPKKRKRPDESTADNIAALRCDLCSMYFVTPAEWVRHVQNTHTETELALSNNSTPPKRTQRTIRPMDGQPWEKSCSVCKKTFPSYASMIIHKRTHTGERPFYCTLCDKGFNVKSNLLRHMRTLHNKLLISYNPTTIIDCHDEANPE